MINLQLKHKWHYCTECEERFKYKFNLDKHMRKEHHTKIYERKKQHEIN
jgi:hypothetical protein